MIQDLDLQIYGLWYQPFWQTRFFWALILTFSVGLIGLIYWLYSRYRGQKSQILYQQLNPQQQALVALERLQKRLSGLDQASEFYGQLVNILKTFLVAKYAEHDLLSMTDSELYQFLRTQAQLTLPQLELLGELLTARSQARFAALNFDQALARHDLYRVQEFVEVTGQ